MKCYYSIVCIKFVFLVPPTITRISPVGDQLTVMEGTPLNVMLNVVGNPQPSFDWLKNGESITGGGGITLSSSSIIFNPVSREHAGTYTLSVMNTAGSDTHTFQLAVTCKYYYDCVCHNT